MAVQFIVYIRLLKIYFFHKLELCSGPCKDWYQSTTLSNGQGGGL